MNSETRQAEILREAFDSCLRVIAGAAAGLEESIFAEWSRHAMKHAVAAGWNKVDAVDRLYQAGTAIGLDVFTIQEALTEAVRLAESNALPDVSVVPLKKTDKPSSWRDNCYSAAELRRRTFPPVEFCVPDLIP